MWQRVAHLFCAICQAFLPLLLLPALALPLLPQPTDQRVPGYSEITTQALAAITAARNTVGGLKGASDVGPGASGEGKGLIFGPDLQLKRGGGGASEAERMDETTAPEANAAM